jgi:hypothetical protein
MNRKRRPLRLSHSLDVIRPPRVDFTCRWRGDRQQEAVLRADQRAGVMRADDHWPVRTN